MYLLSKGTGKVFTDMIEREIEIRLVDGLILPNLMEEHEGEEEHCLFLTDRGRCSIHAFRPGLCRLYPMGRYYTEGGFRYILQKNECTGRVKTDVRLSDWLGIEDLPRYEAYIQDWHDFRKRVEKVVPILTEKSRDSVRRYILQVFFVHPYRTRQDFYPQYEARMEVCKKALRNII
jgi:Fe-S-cluster containining protein